MGRSSRHVLLLIALGLFVTACSGPWGTSRVPATSTTAAAAASSLPAPANLATVPLVAPTPAPSGFPATIPLPVDITVVAAPRPTATPPRPEDWAALRRPLDLPVVRPGEPCPVNRGESVSQAFGPALGNGPVYPIMSRDGVYRYGDVTPQPDGWLPLKVLWVAAPQYQGPVLVRGRQLDDPQNALQLTTSSTGGGDAPQEEPRLFASNVLPQAGWRNWPSHTLIRNPGCYAYQVDGEGFSYSVVFQAVAGGQ